MLLPRYRWLHDDIATRAVPINGVLVFANNDLPKDVPVLMQQSLQKRFEQVGERYGLPNVEDLYVVADGSESQWQVRSKSNPFLAVGVDPIMSKDLEDIRSENRAKHEQSIRELVNAKDADRAGFQKRHDDARVNQIGTINYWRRMAEDQSSFKNPLAASIADRLQQELDEQMALESELTACRKK